MMNTKRLARIALCLAVTVICGFIKIPFGSIYFTFQTVAVLFSGIFLGKFDGAFCQICYLLIGLLGVPIFTNGGGIFYVFQISFGYLLAFPICAFVIGVILSKLKTLSFVKIWLSCIISLLPVYLLGVAYQILLTIINIGATVESALYSLITVLPLLAFDIIICAIIALVLPKIKNNLLPIST